MNTQTTDKATARPWHVLADGKSFGYFEPSYSKTVSIQLGYCEALSRFGQDQKANSALIVRAVNEYDALCKVAEVADKLLYNEDGNIKNAEAMRHTLAALSEIRNQK